MLGAVAPFDPPLHAAIGIGPQNAISVDLYIRRTPSGRKYIIAFCDFPLIAPSVKCHVMFSFSGRTPHIRSIRRCFAVGATYVWVEVAPNCLTLDLPLSHTNHHVENECFVTPG